ncbi:MAG: GIY-YIG nuclease family protein [Paludibacter sp.]|jgi:putative endonuclease|nr:GIY-YIG nuclease family protein [Paludibacter sp.]
MSTFYILYSKTADKYYVGATAGAIEERLHRHNTYHKKGFTHQATDWMVVYSQEFPEKVQAFAREREVKAWKSRKAIEKLISQST